MRTSLKQALAGVLFSAAVGMAPSANALLYNYDFNSAVVNFDLVLNVDTTNGVCPSGCLITAVTGSSPEYGTVSGLLSTGEFWGNNNLFYSPPQTYVNLDGVSFDLVSGMQVNLFYSSDYGAAGKYPASSILAFFLNGTVSVSPLAPVPEPETYAMLLAGLGLLGVLARRRKHRPAS